MGFLDFFTSNGDPHKPIDKIKRRLMDQYRQSHERYEAIDELVKIGTSLALEAMLERFALRVSGPTVDEEEKQYCYTQIAKWGDGARPSLEKFIATKNAIYFPLRALRDLAGEEAAVAALLDAIGDCDPGYHEGLDRLREIVSNLRDFQHDKVRDALVALLESRSNEIRFYALDGLSGYPADQVAGYFAARMIDPAESQRVKALAYELALEHQVPLARWQAEIASVMPPSYTFGGEGTLVRA